MTTTLAIIKFTNTDLEGRIAVQEVTNGVVTVCDIDGDVWNVPSGTEWEVEKDLGEIKEGEDFFSKVRDCDYICVWHTEKAEFLPEMDSVWGAWGLCQLHDIKCTLEDNTGSKKGEVSKKGYRLF